MTSATFLHKTIVLSKAKIFAYFCYSVDCSDLHGATKRIVETRIHVFDALMELEIDKF